MTTFKQAGLLAACILATACGGGGGGGNAAAGRTFTYGAPVAATATETQALDGQLAVAASLQAAPDASGAAALADFSAISGALLGGGLTARLASPRLSASLAAAPLVTGFDDPACVAVTATSVTMRGCSATVVDVDGTMTTVIDGFFKVPAPGSLAWDLTARVTMVSADVNMTVTAHQAGTMDVTDTTILGALRTETNVSAHIQGQTLSAGMHESLDIDVTVDPGPPACVTDGTLEVKRVWTRRPQGATPADLPDGAAKVTWTGCGTGTVAFSR